MTEILAMDITDSDAHTVVEAPPPPQADLPTPRMHPVRFRVAYGVLALVGIAALAGLIVSVTQSGVVGASAPWSSWKPTGADSAQRSR